MVSDWYTKHWTTNQAAHTSRYEAPNTYVAEDCQIWVQSGMMHLTLKRLNPREFRDQMGLWVECGDILKETGSVEEV